MKVSFEIFIMLWDSSFQIKVVISDAVDGDGDEVDDDTDTDEN